MVQEVRRQGRLAGPLVVNLTLNYSISTISLASVGHLGTTELAAAALATVLYSMCGRQVIQGLCGALDTLASQAYGAGNLAALGPIFQETCVFLGAHCIPLTVALLGAPRLLALAEGRDSALCAMAAAYSLRLLPCLWLEVLNRPINRILLAQRITLPQMWVSVVVMVLHAGANWLLIHRFEWGYLGAAWATSLANLNNLLLSVAYLLAAGLQQRVWGSRLAARLSGWAQIVQLAYPACFMKCIESWTFSGMLLVAGLLPDATVAVAAISVAFNCYGLLYMPFVSFGMAVCTRVGNELGAGSAAGAHLAMDAAALVAPALWLAAAAVLGAPAAQRALVGMFTTPGDEALLVQLRRLLAVVMVMLLFDGLQTVLQGVVQGSGKQARGAVVNLVAFYVVGIPLALALAFPLRLGAAGLLLGLLAGSAVQALAYAVLISRLDWDAEARRAALRAGAPARAVEQGSACSAGR
ncbi:hypothetical protein WJX81_002908 [Elliptochloris bilobata]|uniref:Protein DETOXIFICATION n=1 Tax=Elliptochloris bilobata TaxID=381761 RepID=A0AAW1S8Z6_9CHLO